MPRQQITSPRIGTPGGHFSEAIGVGVKGMSGFETIHSAMNAIAVIP